jgi:hypothetical protein
MTLYLANGKLLAEGGYLGDVAIAGKGNPIRSGPD